MITDVEQRNNAKDFAEFYKGKGYEKGQSQSFWLTLLSKVLGIENANQYISFEDTIMLDHTSFIDGYIEETHTLIEQKSIDKSLDKPIKQSDGTFLTPYQQAQRYSANLPYSKRPRWIVICNFAEFHIYDMENPTGEPEKILLKDLPKEYYRLDFLINKNHENLKKETEVSVLAGDLVGQLYDALLENYEAPESEEVYKSLNMLCVRLVFCLYAEDAGIFGHRNMFHDYLETFPTNMLRDALIKLFKTLDTKVENRDKYESKELLAFPYVNGGLFADENIIIPQLDEDIRNLLLDKASINFDWSDISPTIFGAVFESTLNPDTRHDGGMHYTSIENIHKVIDNLFLNELQEEFKNIKEIKVEKTRNKKLEQFQDKISKLHFLDPACGSGNFLTETYLSLRKIENEILESLLGNQIISGFGLINPIKVSIGQFYGIEINDFAVTVAKTALWIAESQMIKKTEDIVHMNIDFLPLKSYANIVECNALTEDWEKVIQSNQLNYIMGNPPFLGARVMNGAQKKDMNNIFIGLKGVGNLDYVSAWYKKATDYIANTSIEVAFVSTNSITQGEQVPILWKFLLNTGIHINFAYRTFNWNSEANNTAHVHCVIIGFSFKERKNKFIFDGEMVDKVDNINPYLIPANNIIVESRTTPLCNVPRMIFGNMANDNGNFILDSVEKEALIKSEPCTYKWIHPFVGSKEFINNLERYCLWLKDVEPIDLKESPTVLKRIEEVKNYRLSSTRGATVRLADTPTLFGEIRQPDINYLIVPRVSSSRRKYIPIGFVNSNVIASDAVQIIPTDDLFIFGVLTSNVHNAWIDAIAGRLKSDYRYSAKIVYNNFPFPKPTDTQRCKIEETAKNILSIRNKYTQSSLADLYDPTLMPPDLSKAHRENDKAVWEAYGKHWNVSSKSECVGYLLNLYYNYNSGE